MNHFGGTNNNQNFDLSSLLAGASNNPAPQAPSTSNPLTNPNLLGQFQTQQRQMALTMMMQRAQQSGLSNADMGSLMQRAQQNALTSSDMNGLLRMMGQGANQGGGGGGNAGAGLGGGQQQMTNNPQNAMFQALNRQQQSNAPPLNQDQINALTALGAMPSGENKFPNLNSGGNNFPHPPQNRQNDNFLNNLLSGASLNSQPPPQQHQNKPPLANQQQLTYILGLAKEGKLTKEQAQSLAERLKSTGGGQNFANNIAQALSGMGSNNFLNPSATLPPSSSPLLSNAKSFVDGFGRQ
ncbi:hypothetical protein BT69DRAFT_925049 [Atractiella rhizophila]|nr:hypothetical protein BT69DRAFT_925049 [Atractiella rhizophila]